jgi:serine O-acetyltransferase
MEAIGHFRSDLGKYYRIEFGGRKPSAWKKCKLWSTHLGLHCVAVYRLSRYALALSRRSRFRAAPLLFLSDFLGFLVKFFHHVDIFAAEIGPGFYIGHVGTVYIGKTRIGENCSVTHNVTIGTGLSGAAPGLPTLGKNVWIGSGSILYGNIHVGDGVTVNCGTVLSRSVPEGSLVGGNPGRILLRHHDNSRLFGLPDAGKPAFAAGQEPPGESAGREAAASALPSREGIGQ